MNRIPSGTVTFLFTDIEGSTKLAQEHPDETPALLARHNEILKQSIQLHNGYVFQVVGDSFSAAFHSASDALNAALNAQGLLQNESWNPAPIKVRMGIHTGTAQLNEHNQYTGYATLATTQRIMSAGHGGQVLISNATQQLIRDRLSEGLSLRDMGEFRLKDLIRPERLYQLVSPNLPAEFPPLKTLDVYRHNLPTQLTSFIGRAHEIDEITKLITDHRVITLTGSGGAGKTRLSLQVGAECLEQFPNGVWFVELAPLTEPSLIIGAVMSVFGLHEKDDDIHALAKYIESQSMLLILDNCEHLIEDCARLAERLIQSCPKLHVLASSREALGIAGEHPYRVPSLPFPDPKHLSSLEEIEKCESVQLFIERIRTFAPSFALTEKNAPAVAQICSHLDGIPLALELAAARVKVMSVEQMASRLGDIFNLLTSGNRTALPRQQTLRALIEWSYDLLSDSEKNLFRKLAAFSGGWSLEAAESICSVGQDGILPHDVLDDLARLVDKSLVVKDEHDGEARFHMLETIRQYAEFKMFASEEVEEVKNRHRDWFMQLAEEAEPQLRTAEQVTWLNQLELEHDNLRAALNWSIEQKHIEQALRIPSALTYFWEIHGHEAEGRNWLKQALELDDDAKKKYPFAWATAVHGIASLSAHIPQFQSYHSQVKEALNIFREHGDDFRVGHTLYHLAYFPHFAGELETAKARYEESHEVYKKINNHWGMGNCLHCIAHIAEQQGAVDEAQKIFNQSLDFLKPIGDRYSLYHPAGDTALIAIRQGEFNTAREILEESLSAFEELENHYWVAVSLQRLAVIFHKQGDFATALDILKRSNNISTELNSLSSMGWDHYTFGIVYLAMGDIPSARQYFEQAFELFNKTEHKANIGYATIGVGLMDCYQNNAAQGIEKIEKGMDGVRGEYLEDASELVPALGHALWLNKNLPRAHQAYRDAIIEFRNAGNNIHIPECLEGLAKIAVAQNQLERGARLFGAAEAMREKMGTPIPPIQRRDYEAHVQSLGTAIALSWSRGREMTMDEAIALALDETHE